ncbi:condensation domain-containing protein, partial [Fulvivirga kasyanovii]|uniref:condensation domain-containing protein n=1 Tax=Fulvivirga kasyanovii TaxID=396812 RepID=UPI0031DD80C9
ARFEGDASYWQSAFSDGVPVLELPTDYPRPAVKTYKGLTCRRVLDSTLTGALTALAQSHEVSLFMVFEAAIYTLLYRYTDQEDIVLGSPVSGRDHHDLEGQIGFYVNTLALRTRFSGEESFSTLLEKVKQTTLSGYAHQSYPFDRLVDDLDLSRDMSRTPLFDVMLAYQHGGEWAEEPIEGLHIRPYPAENVVSKFDLLFNVIEETETIAIELDYNTDLFSGARIERLLGHLEHLLGAVTTDPGQALYALDYLSAAEKQEL